ncbi:MAG: Mu-like prophage major head subunit gpT family protein [Fimbriimonadaceae bacterium]|nr:Mu-like prophage major head subunit gpT family protein [Fimbriimonadaceae bacterium]
MPLTRSDIPDLLLPGLKTEFETAFRAELEDGLAEKIATVINTSRPVQKYPWLGAAPPMREFIDERRPAGLSAFSVTIEDKVFESTIAVDRRAMEDDQLGLIRVRVRDLAHRVSQHRHQIVVETLNQGNSLIGFDGKPLFATDHPIGSGTASNSSSAALSAASLQEAISAMMTFTDDSGTPMGIMPDTLVVGPNRMWQALELVESRVVVDKGGGSGRAQTPYMNALQGRLKVAVSPFIRNEFADRWYVLDTRRPIRAVILQQREDVPVEFSALEAGSGSESAWMRDRYHYGVRARYNTGLGLWQAAYAGAVS